ncbi:hypothetical protein ES703_121863 [subsurface metagenome]
MSMERFKVSDCQRVILEVAEIDEETNAKVYKEFYCDIKGLTTGAMDVLMPVMGQFLADIQKTAKGGVIPDEATTGVMDIVLKSLKESPKMLVDILVEVVTVKEAKSGDPVEDIVLRDWLTENVSPPSLLSLVDIAIALTDLEMYAADFIETQTQLTGMLIPKAPKKPKSKTTRHPAQRQKR